jgi:valyl-tRNA synthetase
MLGLYVAGDIPFREVYIHGYVMAEDGSKMSKSVGNVVDPLPVIDQYGSDALRMGIIAGRAPAVNRGYDPRRVEEARNFCNKLWNIARYVEGTLETAYTPGSKPEPQSTADHWMLRKLQQATETLTELLDDYRFSEAYEHLYHFVWDDVADWYIEASKSQQSREVLGYVLENVLKLAHPFAPFVTETIWQTLYSDTDSLLITSHWPKPLKGDKQQAAEFEELRAIITEIRSLVKALSLSRPNLYYTDVPFLAANHELLVRMSGLESVKEVSSGTGLQLSGTRYRCWLDVDTGMMKQYADKLATQLTAQEKLIAQLQARLDNKGYTENAPKEIVAETKEHLHNAQDELERLKIEQTRFRST